MLIRVQALLCGLIFCSLAADGAFAFETPTETPNFTKHVQPIFEAKCIRCHGAARRGGKLDMRSVESMLAGGVSGPAIRPGNAQKSLLIELIHFNEMPPKKEPSRVTKEELELLRNWIDALGQDASAAPVTIAEIRQTVDKSLAFLEKDGLEWETKKCVSCHHGPWMMWTGYEARKRGFTVNEESLAQVRAGALKAYNTHPKLKPTSRDLLTDLTINITYLTFGMGASGEPDAETAKFFDRAAAHLLEQQKEDGSWKVIIKKTSPEGVTTTFLMPPLIDSDDVTTLWALLTLYYCEPSNVSREALDKSKAMGLKFLRDNPPSDSLQSLVLRIMLSKRLGKTDDMQTLVRQLVDMQKNDGGWSQVGKLPPDALGTGQALVALAAAGVTSEDPAVRKAWFYLLKTQKPNGAWDVISRAYEPPEFSGYMGTAWAVLGLVGMLPERADAAVQATLPIRNGDQGE